MYSVLRSSPPNSTLAGCFGEGDAGEELSLGTAITALAFNRAGRDDAAVRCDGMPSIPRPARVMDHPSIPDLARGTSVCGDQDPSRGSVVDVQRLLICRKHQPVGLLRAGQKWNHVAFKADQVDAFRIQLTRLGADVARVGNIDASSRSTATSFGLLNRLLS